MANNIEFRRVITRMTYSSGATETESWQYRTKDVVASILGLIPLASTWSSWTDISTTTVVQDEHGTIIG